MYHPVDIHVGKRLRLRRTLLGLSQEDVAHVLGITFQQIQKNEKGLNRMGASRLYDLSKLLKCDIGYFFEELPQPAMPPTLPVDDNDERLYARESLELMRAYYKIADDKVRQGIFGLVKTMGRAQNPSSADGA